MTEYRCLVLLDNLSAAMVSDYSSVIGRQSQEAREQALAGRNDKLKRRKRRRRRQRREEEARWGKRCLTKRESECFSSGMSLPILLTFG